MGHGSLHSGKVSVSIMSWWDSIFHMTYTLPDIKEADLIGKTQCPLIRVCVYLLLVLQLGNFALQLGLLLPGQRVELLKLCQFVPVIFLQSFHHLVQLADLQHTPLSSANRTINLSKSGTVNTITADYYLSSSV